VAASWLSPHRYYKNIKHTVLGHTKERRPQHPERKEKEEGGSLRLWGARRRRNKREEV
jgi:hypothetical protein